MVLETLHGVRAGVRAIVFEGTAGIGKTALWRRSLDSASELGFRVLACTPVGSEVQLSFAALGDLLDGEIDEALSALPSPQRRALEIVLLRRESEDELGTPDRRTIGVGMLGALRVLAASGPVLVAIDDLQWLDGPSASALQFVLRRLRTEPIAVVATRRTEPDVRGTRELERILGDERVLRLRLDPLSLGALHELLRARLGLELSRPTLIRLHETSGGNPFFALEIGRELIALGSEPPPHERLPVPANVRDLVRARLGRLQPRTRSVLLAVAALARPTPALLARVSAHAEEAITEAVAVGVLELSGGRLRFMHPLLASIHYDDATARQRREVHARLSEIVDDVEARARHLALATTGLDVEVARQLDDAARYARDRGSPDAAAELCDLSARLTPPGAERSSRALAAAEHYHRAGNLTTAAARANEVLTAQADVQTRVRALAVLGTVAGDTEDTDEAVLLYRRALREPAAPRALRADLHHKLAWIRLGQGDARCAGRHAQATLRLAAGADAAGEATAAATLSLVEAARGSLGWRPLLERALKLDPRESRERPWAWSETGVAALEGVVLLWAGELEQARVPLERMLQSATERGDPWLLMHALAYLSPLETGLGFPARGLTLAGRYFELALDAGQRAGALWPTAVAAGWLGRIDEATAAAREGLELAERTGHGLFLIGNLTALGAAELSAGRHEAAADALLRARELAARGGVRSVARFPMLANAVEALVATGELQRAAALAAELDDVADAVGRPWVLALAARCAGLIADARAKPAAALAAFERALTEHGRQDRPLERSRTLLAYGSALRRQSRKRGAREALEPALAIFEAAGATRWAERTRTELGRIGGRQPPPAGMLSATESAVAELVAAGQSNREVAAALHLSVRTVEWNLSKLYRKLGVSSRTALAVALGRGSSTDRHDRSDQTAVPAVEPGKSRGSTG